MMSGLRSHLEYTITWVSERSGMASSFVFFIACQPKSTATPTNRSTRNFRRAENSISLLIMGSLRKQLLQAENLPTIGGHEIFSVFFLGESERAWRAPVERRRFGMLHVVHAHRRVRAGDRPAVIDVVGLRRVNHLRG